MANEKAAMAIETKEFGKTKDGTAVQQFTLTNKHGIKARIMTYGATWTHMIVPDKDGKMGDILLGHDTLEPYLVADHAQNPYFGSIVGRVGNRIAKGKFTLDGKEYTLATNNGPNHLHGGKVGFDQKVWKAEPMPNAKDGPAVKFTTRSPDMEEGYPGNLDVSVVYTLTQNDEVRIDYEAKTDKATPINLTNHAYFNLHTPANGTILDHLMLINADNYTPVDDTLIPTGQIAPVKGTPFDFTKAKAIGKDIAQTTGNPNGYDHNFVLNGSGMKVCAKVMDPETGRTMEIQTDQPGVQFYTGNFLDGSFKGKGGVTYKKNFAFCLETQHFPDSINHENFPSSVLKPGETYKTTTVHKFGVRK
jgi:aldose 1-epimerase